jgi:hypothetical protein
VSDQSAALDEIPAVCAPLMTRLNDGPHLKKRRAIKRNGVGRRILVVLTDMMEGGGPFLLSLLPLFSSLCKRTAVRS